MPGILFLKNITPTGIGRYTDDELFRAFTIEVTKKGKASLPRMPYTYYGKTEDIYAVIAYVRSLGPIDNQFQIPNSISRLI